jgi:hypothetical protein
MSYCLKPGIWLQSRALVEGNLEWWRNYNCVSRRGTRASSRQPLAAAEAHRLPSDLSLDRSELIYLSPRERCRSCLGELQAQTQLPLA